MTSFTCMTNNVKSRHNHFSDCHWFRANRDDAMEKQGIASIAILPSGSISGHFVDTRTSECLGIFGTQIECERECSRGEDYKLIDLCILEFQMGEACRGCCTN
ncbi:hypothetical protein KP509_03G059500 [Ceratopteris richardii]|uniref:Uncharacterized protein n=1 Tax=Ceratopteris richardii TaxID=49495 RepID=A0A8T2V793_CERRI|nr:hypothetical protein KP509_03G059500 [Ceratopteris richardii]